MLSQITNPSDLKKYHTKDLDILCEEIRTEIISAIYKNGGHMSSNLGIVELTVALHYVFDAPKDKIIFDVGHQCYTHKILTGRKLKNLRKFGGISGFTSPDESPYDVIWAGHSSTSLSQALGMCRARDLKGEDYTVIAVIGDASIGSGMALEALNDIGSYKGKLIIVLNDNEMSIEKNVGAMSAHFSKLRLSPSYRKFKARLRNFLSALPLIGNPLRRFSEYLKNIFAGIFLRKNMFHAFGIKYAGVYDGHNISEIVKAFNTAKKADTPVVLHFHTKKGKGHEIAEQNPADFHGVKSEFVCGTSAFSSRFGEILCEKAAVDNNIVAVTAAMRDGTGLKCYANNFPDRFFDTGISEQHSVTLCAGMANGGLKPYFAVYSTFLQRAFDQISNDICLPNLPVTLIIDRAGICGADGETHHGLLDIANLSCLPNITIFAPRDLSSLEKIMDFSTSFNGPLAIRYENTYAQEIMLYKDVADEFNYGKWQIINEINSKVNIVSYGNRMLTLAKKAIEILSEENIECGIIDACFIKPFDTEMFSSLTGTVIVLEEASKGGNLYGILSAYAAENKCNKVLKSISLPLKYITFGETDKILSAYGISSENIAGAVREIINFL